jgi:hypothetical protein
MTTQQKLFARKQQSVQDIEITEECRALIAAEFPIDETLRRLPKGNWQIQRRTKCANLPQDVHADTR